MKPATQSVISNILAFELIPIKPRKSKIKTYKLRLPTPVDYVIYPPAFFS